MTTRYITSPIYYLNGEPHLGHVYTTVAGDVLARYWREKLGDDNVFFVTGTDEHGAKIAEAAAVVHEEPKVFVDRLAAQYQAIWRDRLDVTYDYFLRTTNPAHETFAQAFVQKLYDAGEIEKGVYEGLYCVGCEKFVTDSELVNPSGAEAGGRCPDHPNKELIQHKEENYFFKLSAWAPRVRESIERNELVIWPAHRRNEVLARLKDEVRDISISRAHVSWGIPVPWDTDQTIYVWFEALLNYASALEMNDKLAFWPPTVQLMGKEILWFHAVIWPAMLLAAGQTLPKKLVAHGWFTVDGQKMSKTIGNVVDPNEAVEIYGVDALRYYLLREIPTTDDGDFSWKRFEELYNHELADNLGNLLSRVVQMASKFCEGKAPAVSSELENTANIVAEAQEYLEELDLQKSLLAINRYISQLNVLVDVKKPWELAKQGKQEEINTVLYQLLEGLRIVALLLAPFLPETAGKIYASLGLGNVHEIKTWPEEINWGRLPAETSLQPVPILFPKKV